MNQKENKNRSPALVHEKFSKNVPRPVLGEIQGRNGNRLENATSDVNESSHKGKALKLIYVKRFVCRFT